MTLKTIIRRIIKWASDEPKAPAKAAQGLKINPMLAAFLATPEPQRNMARKRYEVKRPELPPGVVPESAKTDTTFMATDSACSAAINYACSSYQGDGFPGYPYLAQLLQRSEFRSPVETTAMEMTRKWVKLVSHGDGDKTERIEKLEAALKRRNVRDLFRLAAEQDGGFGRSQIYVNIQDQDDDERRKLPLIISKESIKKGSLIGFKVIEPIWTTPYDYNSGDPTAPDFYRPRMWFVLGRLTHATRLLSFISRPVPDLLKPAYNFGGLSMSQLMEVTVDNWTRTRQSVSDITHSFSTSGLATNMAAELGGGGTLTGLLDRMKLWMMGKDNRGMMLLDKDSEEFFQHNTPLSGLHELQAQAQEHMAAPCHMPLVKLLGITPSGLNASAEPEMDAWRDYIGAMQENLFGANLTAVLKILQLDEFGDIDPAIGYEFIPIEQPNPVELAAARKSDVDAAVALVGAGVLSPEEERTRLAASPESGYSGINVADVPEPPGDPDVKPDDKFKEAA